MLNFLTFLRGVSVTARIALSFVLAAALFTGCDDKKPDPKVDNKTPSADKSAEDAKKVAEDAKAKADAAAAAAKDATDTAGKAAADAAATAKASATDWMTKLEDAIKAKKLDDAKTYLDKLEAIKASLPADLQSKLTSLKTTYDTAKAAPAIPGGTPAIPGLPANK